MGRVKSFKNHKKIIMKPHKTIKGYYQIVLYKNGKAKRFQIHRLVAKAFIKNFENKPAVNHIDGNKLNNIVDNLEWCTLSENTLHAYRTGLEKITERKIACGKKYAQLNFNWEKLKKKVDQFDLQGNFIRTWESGTEAERQLNLPHSKVAACCVGRRKSTGGFIWKHHIELEG